MREIEYDPKALPYEPPKDELDTAVELVAEVTDAASRDAPLPEEFPKKIIPLFKDYGKNLREGESFEQKPIKSTKAAVYSMKTRDRILERSEGEYEDFVDLTGEIRSADLDGLNFNLRIEDGTKLPGKFTLEQEEIITGALREHATQQLRVKGRAEFSPPDGRIKRIISVYELSLEKAGEGKYDSSARPIWEIAVEIGASVPDGEWQKVPKDLAKDIDHYLYGHSKEN